MFCQINNLKKTAVSFTLILLTISTCLCVQNYLWENELSPQLLRSSFQIQVAKDSIIKGDIKIVNNSPYNYKIVIYQPNKSFPYDQPYQTIQMKSSMEFSSVPTDQAGRWTIEVLPVDFSQMFIFEMEIKRNDQRLGSLVGIARYKKIFPIFHLTKNTSTISVDNILEPFKEHIIIQLYSGTSQLDFKLTNLIFNNPQPRQTKYSITYDTEANKYYYLIISTNTVLSGFKVKVNYQSQEYPCPYDDSFIDVHQGFKACSSDPVVKSNIQKIAQQQLNQQSSQPTQQPVQPTLPQQPPQTITQPQQQTEPTPPVQPPQPTQQLTQQSAPQPIQTAVLSNNLPIYARNCIVADSNLQVCLSCRQTHTQHKGICYLLKECPEGQFQLKDQCKFLIPFCVLYNDDGICNRCDSGYKLNWTIKALTCIKIELEPIQCSKGFYPKNNLCFLMPQKCAKMDLDLDMCELCEPSFVFNPFTLECILQTRSCSSGLLNINNQCVPISPHCIQANNFNKCLKCQSSILYSLANGSCVEVECSQGQVRISGICRKISQGCQRYNDSGFCLGCKNGYIFDSQGTCIQQTAFQTIPFSSTGCNSRQYKKGKICIAVDSLCQTFNPTNGFCTSCISNRYTVNQNSGKCDSIIDICAPGYYFNFQLGTCSQISDYCQEFDHIKSQCKSCKGRLTLFLGNCLFLQPCALNQYRRPDGSCQTADPLCNGIDNITGRCLGCVAGYQLNHGGICCYSLNYMLTTKCKSFLSQNCVQQRPTFMNCLQCESGYSLKMGLFGKCHK